MTLPRVLWTARSSNKKLGPIPSCIVQDTTCSDTCPLKKNGCYAKAGALGYHWRKLNDFPEHRLAVEFSSWTHMLNKVTELPSDTLWRYAVAGDLPGENRLIDTDAMTALYQANHGSVVAVLCGSMNRPAKSGAC